MDRLVSVMLVITLSVLPIHGYTADSLATVGRAAQTLGKEQANALQQSAGKVEQGQITLPSLKNGQFSSEGQPSFSVTELFPGTSASQPAKTIFRTNSNHRLPSYRAYMTPTTR